MAIKKINSAESWDKIYQAYEQINFTSYDYETVKESLIEYMRHYYPEDFNDYIESSEMIMMAEIFAYVAELIAYRVDMGMHENTILNAERKQSILRLAKLISYNATRNLPARGLVKITSVSTSERIIDSQGNNLANRVINWNDINNALWKEQFFLVINRLLSKPFGQPSKSFQVDDVSLQLYTLENDEQSFTNSVFNYSVTTNSEIIPMEIVSVDIDDNGPFEKYIDGTTPMNILYSNDGLGDSSDMTGFLFYTKQGRLSSFDYQFNTPIPNRSVDINVPNINDVDIWVNKVDDDGIVIERWNKIENINSQNIHFNTTEERTKFEIETLEDDNIRLLFGDGDFSDIPTGNFQVWVRQSINRDIVIQKSRVTDESLSFSYRSNFDITETSNMTFSLVSTLQNSSSSEDIEHIRRTAPSTYYSQNRMVNGQDYNTLLLRDPSILKLRAVNRTFSGQPKYIDWNDASGNYQNIKLFGDDLTLYQDLKLDSITSTISSRNLIDDVIEPLLKQPGLINAITSIGVLTGLEDVISNIRTQFIQESYLLEKDLIQGYLDGDFYGDPGNSQGVASEPTFGLSYSKTRDILPDARSITNLNVSASPDETWTIECINEAAGAGTFSIIGSISGYVGTVEANQPFTGIITFDSIDPDGSTDFLVGDAFIITVTSGVGVVDDTKNLAGKWSVISEIDLDLSNNRSNFDPTTTGTSNDSSWIILIERNSDLLGNVIDWVISFRDLKIIVESNTTRFWYNDSVQIIDPNTKLRVHDRLSILKSNLNKAGILAIGKNQVYDVVGAIKNNDGTINTNALEVISTDFSGIDLSGDGKPDNALQFSQFINTLTPKDYVYFSVVNVNELTPIEPNTTVLDSFIIDDTTVDSSITEVPDGSNTTFTLTSTPITDITVTVDSVVLSSGFVITDNSIDFTVPPVTQVDVSYDDGSLTNGLYERRVGRSNLDFLWQHYSPNSNLIDPSTSNIIDIFTLTKGYYDNVTSYIEGNSPYAPVAPTSLELRNTYRDLLNTKMISDTVVMHSGEIKLLFGELADPQLRAKFRIIKQQGSTLADDQLRAQVLGIIKDYFNINNWDFGDTFYNTDLSSVIHQKLPLDIASIVLVPTFVNNLFGSLLVIESAEDEIFQSAASLNDIEVVDSFNSRTIRQYE